MTSKELNLRLLKLLPEIKKIYDDEVSWQEGDETGSHVVFGDVLYPFIEKNIISEDTQSLSKSFDVIEKILLYNDDYANEVITLSVLENLLYLSTTKIDFKIYMGNATKSTFDKMLNDLNSEV